MVSIQYAWFKVYSELDRKDSARMVFRKLSEFKRAPDKFRIRANIELAKNTPNDSTSILMLARLRKLIKNSDNRKFLNELYYQAGVIQEGRNKLIQRLAKKKNLPFQ